MCKTRTLWTTAWLLATGILFTTNVVAEPPKKDSPSDIVRRQNEVAAQKLVAEVREAILEAQQYLRTDPYASIEILKKAQVKLENDKLLTDSRRTSLARLVKGALVEAEGQAKKVAAKGDKKITDEARRDKAKNRLEDDKRIKLMLDYVRELQKDGKHAEANKVLDGLAEAYPDNVSIQSMRRVTGATGGDKKIRDLKKERDRAERKKDIDNLRASMLPADDIVYPKDWKEKTAKRKKAVLSARESKILTVLNSRLKDVDFKNARIMDVIQYIADKTGEEALVDKVAMDDLNITYDTPVTVRGKDMTVRTLLRLTLTQLGMDYIVKNEKIQITSKAIAKETLVVKVYNVDDLVTPVGGFYTPLQIAYLQQQAGENLVNMIVATVDPESWEAKGGKGTIKFDLGTRSLIVSQSAEFHSVLGSSFGR